MERKHHNSDFVNSSIDPSIPTLITSEVVDRSLLRNDSMKSIHSDLSNKSDRQIILARAKKEIIESRLSKNISSLSKENERLSKSRSNSIRSQVRRQRDSRDSRGGDFGRSKSIGDVGVSKSRSKILGQIASKLEKQKEENESVKSFQCFKKKDQTKVRFTKLDNLLKDIKKYNQQSSKVVYTIQKSQRNFMETQRTDNDGLMRLEVRKLAQELREVREELKEAKKKNEHLVTITKLQVNNYQFERFSTSKYRDRPCQTCGCTCQRRIA